MTADVIEKSVTVYRCPRCGRGFRILAEYNSHSSPRERSQAEVVKKYLGKIVLLPGHSVGRVEYINPCSSIYHARVIHLTVKSSGFSLNPKPTYLLSPPLEVLETMEDAQSILQHDVLYQLDCLFDRLSDDAVAPWFDTRDIDTEIPPKLETVTAYECPICGLTFDNRLDAERHVRFCPENELSMARSMVGKYMARPHRFGLEVAHVIDVHEGSSKLRARVLVVRYGSSSVDISLENHDIGSDWGEVISATEAASMLEALIIGRIIELLRQEFPELPTRTESNDGD